MNSPRKGLYIVVQGIADSKLYKFRMEPIYDKNGYGGVKYWDSEINNYKLIYNREMDGELDPGLYFIAKNIEPTLQKINRSQGLYVEVTYVYNNNDISNFAFNAITVREIIHMIYPSYHDLRRESKDKDDWLTILKRDFRLF